MSPASESALNMTSYAELTSTLARTIDRTDGGGVAFVRGWFNEVLTPSLARQRRMQPALYIDMDVDLYSSAISVLKWLFCSGMMEAGSTVVRYDDWVGSDAVGQLMGEKRAHFEITQLHHVVWERPFLFKQEWLLLASYRLNEQHCAQNGYSIPPKWLQSPRPSPPELLPPPPPPPMSPLLPPPPPPPPPRPPSRRRRRRKSSAVASVALEKDDRKDLDRTPTAMLQASRPSA